MPRRRAAIGLMAFCLSAALAGPGVAAEPVRLVMPVVYGTHLPGLGEPASRLAKLVKQLSGDALELDLKQPGDGTQPQEILDKVSRGSVDAGFSTASFWAAKIPAAALFAGFPFGPDAKGYVEWFFAGNGLKLYQEMYDQADMNVHVIPCAFGGGEASGWFTKEIRAPEDIKGLRMRGFGLGGRVMSRLGAQTVLVPGGKIGEAFDKHEIDGAEFLTPAVDQRQRLQDHAKIIYVPGWHQPETVLELLDQSGQMERAQRRAADGARDRLPVDAAHHARRKSAPASRGTCRACQAGRPHRDLVGRSGACVSRRLGGSCERGVRAGTRSSARC